MKWNTLVIVLRATGALVAGAWLGEVLTVGPGFISIYLAPLAFGPILASELIRLRIASSQRDKSIF